jgi:alkanesulfonate monooxygenase SsuD/methylene tetrahydromethanopterin reductase-like flavin-dependent oxidoreductase (luciferase family)
MPRPLKVGLVMPDVEGMYDGRMVRWPDIAALARTAEDVGFDSLWLGDHFLYRFPGLGSWGVWESWSLMAALAASTERVELGTMVTVTPWRPPGLLAKIVDTVEEVSGGRVILGVGAGSHQAEFPAFGYDGWGDRISRFEEEIQILTTLLRTGRIDHQGTYHTLRDCELRPRGPRPQGPPVMVGAVGDRMLRIAARYGDSWNIPWRHDVQEVITEVARGEEVCREVGRDPATLARSVCLHVDVPGLESQLPEILRESRSEAIKGDVGEVAEALRGYARAGVSHLQVWLDPANPAAVEAFAPVLQELDRTVGSDG